MDEIKPKGSDAGTLKMYFNNSEYFGLPCEWVSSDNGHNFCQIFHMLFHLIFHRIMDMTSLQLSLNKSNESDIPLVAFVLPTNKLIIKIHFQSTL